MTSGSYSRTQLRNRAVAKRLPKPVEFHAALASDSNRKAAVGIGNLLSSIGDPDFMAHLFQGQSKIRADSPRAADPADRIDH